MSKKSTTSNISQPLKKNPTDLKITLNDIDTSIETQGPFKYHGNAQILEILQTKRNVTKDSNPPW